MAITSWFMRIDRYCSVHAVRSQDTVKKGGKDSSNSCGIASILMVNFKQKKHLMVAGVSAGAAISSSGVPGGTYIGGQLSKLAIEQAVKEEPEIYKIYSSVTGSIYNGSAYSDAMNFPEVLRQLGLGTWSCDWVGPGGFFAAAKASTDKGVPVIGHVAWKGGGAHFVVIDEAHSSTISVCDPWDAELRIVDAKAGQAIDYDPNGWVWSFSLGGNRHEYDKPSPGTFSGWIVRKTA